MLELELAKITGKGQMTIPQSLREAMGLKPGDYVVVRPLMGGIFIAKATVTPQVTAEDSLRQLAMGLGRAAEQQGIRDEEDLDAIIEEAQAQVYQERYGR